MTEITEDQRYGLIEAIAHLINRDYSLIGDDFVNMDFIPRGVDTAPIVPALARVFDAALAGGGAKSLNFQELAADLAQITYEYACAGAPCKASWALSSHRLPHRPLLPSLPLVMGSATPL